MLTNLTLLLLLFSETIPRSRILLLLLMNCTHTQQYIIFVSILRSYCDARCGLVKPRRQQRVHLRDTHTHAADPCRDKIIGYARI